MEDIYEKYKVKAITTIAYNGEKTCVCFFYLTISCAYFFIYLFIWFTAFAHKKYHLFYVLHRRSIYPIFYLYRLYIFRIVRDRVFSFHIYCLSSSFDIQATKKLSTANTYAVYILVLEVNMEMIKSKINTAAAGSQSSISCRW